MDTVKSNRTEIEQSNITKIAVDLTSMGIDCQIETIVYYYFIQFWH